MAEQDTTQRDKTVIDFIKEIVKRSEKWEKVKQADPYLKMLHRVKNERTE